jgi:hypothetical protein
MSTEMSKNEVVNLGILIVEKGGSIKDTLVKEYKENELFKKCGFKKEDGFVKQTTWSSVKINGVKYTVDLYGKTEGKANTENKYDFPPPVDNTLFFGSCALVCRNEESKMISLSLELWNKIYEKLFGGFENLADTCIDDEEEEDELAGVSAEKKTKQGYLKDGFVVDSEEDENEFTDVGTDDEVEEEVSEEAEEMELEDIGSELSEEEYLDEDDEL